MKFLVDKFTGSISGAYSDIDNKPVSGAMIISVPSDFKFNIDPTIDSPTLSDLLTQKYANISDKVSGIFPYTNTVNQEFIDPSAILNTAYSNLYSIGPNRRTVLKPTGILSVGTAGSGYSFANIPTDFYCEYNVYEITADSNGNAWGPPVYRVNTSFDPIMDVEFRLLDNTGADLQTLVSGYNQASVGMYTGDFLVGIENLSTRTFVLSDFCLYWKE